MTTTHHHDEATSITSGGTVRKTRLGSLLIRRKNLAVCWAEQQSHHLPEADDTAHELAVVERAIGHCYPSVYDRQFVEWVVHDAALLHAADSPSSRAACGRCWICRAQPETTTTAGTRSLISSLPSCVTGIPGGRMARSASNGTSAVYGGERRPERSSTLNIDSNRPVPVWTLATEDISLPDVIGQGDLTPARLAELRTVLATLAATPIATLEVHPMTGSRDRHGGIALHSSSPLAKQLSQLDSDTARSSSTAKAAVPAVQSAASGEVLYRMVIPAKMAEQVGRGLVKPMAAKGMPGGIYSGLRDSVELVGAAAFVPVAGKAATAGAGAAAAGAGGAAGAAGGTAGAAVGAVATAGVITVAAPLVLMAVAVGVSAYAEQERQKAIERITDLLEQLHENNLDEERSELDGCRDAIDKATAILLDQGRIGPALGLDSAVHAISKSMELSGRRLAKWRDSLAKLPDGPVELKAIKKAFPGIVEDGGIFRAHLELARLTIALKRRVLVLQAVEHAQMAGGTNSFTNFVGALQEDERRVNDLEAGLSAILFRLSTLELKRSTGLHRPLVTPGEVDTLLHSVYRLRAMGDDLSLGVNSADVAIEIERRRDGSLMVFPAVAV